jgi:predicted metal-dependent phosphoesterase TrpH
MKVDLHVHTKERSQCASASTLEQIQTAIAAGLDVIALTDHGQLAPAEEISRLNTEYAPFRILDGIEIAVGGEDIVVLGLRDPSLVTEKWDYPRLHGFVRAQGGVLVLAHPFRYRPNITIPIQEFAPDAIEVCSGSTPRHAVEQIEAVAQSLGIPVISNSDAHVTEALGRHYNVLDKEARNAREVLDLIKAGMFTAVVRETDGTTKEFPRRGFRAHDS